jgi:hypothetical protein
LVFQFIHRSGNALVEIVAHFRRGQFRPIDIQDYFGSFVSSLPIQDDFTVDDIVEEFLQSHDFIRRELLQFFAGFEMSC